MPISRLMVILAAVIGLAVITVGGGLILADRFEMSRNAGLATLSLIALCVSFAWRRHTDKAKDDQPRK